MTGTTILKRVKAGARFTWGRVVKIHEIGPYSIVEFKAPEFERCSPTGREEEESSFHPYADGVDWSNTYGSLDTALCAAIAVRRGNYHSAGAAYYMMRLVEDPETDVALVRALVRKVGKALDPVLNLRRTDGGKADDGRGFQDSRHKMVRIWKRTRDIDDYGKTGQAVEDLDWLTKELED